MARPPLIAACEKMRLHRCGKGISTLVDYLDDNNNNTKADQELGIFVTANLAINDRAQLLEFIDFAHDIKDMLNAIPGGSALLKNDPKVAKAIDSFYQAVDKLEHMIPPPTAGGAKSNDRTLTFGVECVAKGIGINNCTIRFEMSGDGRIGISTSSTNMSVSAGDLLRAARIIEAQGGKP
jgi:hypothetical protein